AARCAPPLRAAPAARFRARRECCEARDAGQIANARRPNAKEVQNSKNHLPFSAWPLRIGLAFGFWRLEFRRRIRRMLAIVDSGGANIASVRFALERLRRRRQLPAGPAGLPRGQGGFFP